jgi:hypothetical protein
VTIQELKAEDWGIGGHTDWLRDYTSALDDATDYNPLLIGLNVSINAPGAHSKEALSRLRESLAEAAGDRFPSSQPRSTRGS